MVNPGSDEGAVRVGPAALGELVLVVREEKIGAAAVHVCSIKQMLHDHRRALDVPSRTPGTPRALPRGLGRLRSLPEGEVQGALLVPGLALFRLAHLLGTLVAEATVLGEALDGVVDVTVAGGVSVTLPDKLPNERDHLGDVLGGARFDIWEADAEEREPLVEGVGVAAHDLLPGDALLVGLVDDLVLHVSDVLDVGDVVAPALEVPHRHVPEQRRPRVPYVDVVVDRGPADVEP